MAQRVYTCAGCGIEGYRVYRAGIVPYTGGKAPREVPDSLARLDPLTDQGHCGRRGGNQHASERREPDPSPVPDPVAWRDPEDA